MKAAMQRRVEEAVAEAEAKAAGLRDAREKNVHFSARVVALNSRVAQLQKQLREAAAREKELAAELELKRGGGMELPLENGGANPDMAFGLQRLSPFARRIRTVGLGFGRHVVTRANCGEAVCETRRPKHSCGAASTLALPTCPYVVCSFDTACCAGCLTVRFPLTLWNGAHLLASLGLWKKLGKKEKCFKKKA